MPVVEVLGGDNQWVSVANADLTGDRGADVSRPPLVVDSRVHRQPDDLDSAAVSSDRHGAVQHGYASYGGPATTGS